MSSLPKEIKNIKPKSSRDKNNNNKYSKRPHRKLRRLKNEKNLIPINSYYLYNKNIMLNSIVDKNTDKNSLMRIINRSKKKNFYRINSSNIKRNNKVNLYFNQANNNENNDKFNSGNTDINIYKPNIKNLSAKTRDINYENNSNKLKQNFFDDIKLKNIIYLWNELEVLKPYRIYYLFIYKEIDEDEKQNLYENEINELIELKNDIKNLTYNIELRFGIIKRLFELYTKLTNEIKNNNENNINNLIINEIIKKIEKLNELAVNIVLYMKKIKLIINNCTNLSKYNIDIISKKYNFDKNYIIKMRSETNFLRDDYIKEFLNIKNEESPFLLKVYFKNMESKNEKFVTLNQNIKNNIKECNYYIYKELIAYQNEKANKRVFKCISPLRNKNSKYNYYNNKYINDNITENENEKNQLIKNKKELDNNNNIIQKDENKNNIQYKRNTKENINNSIKNLNSKVYSIDNSNSNRRIKKMLKLNYLNHNRNNVNNLSIKNNKNSDNNLNNIYFKNKDNNIILSKSKSEINLQKNDDLNKILNQKNNLPSYSKNNNESNNNDIKKKKENNHENIIKEVKFKE